MTIPPDSYSYADDLKRYRREKQQKKKLMDRLTGLNLEPRKYTLANESFARRHWRGVSIRSGGLHEIE